MFPADTRTAMVCSNVVRGAAGPDLSNSLWPNSLNAGAVHRSFSSQLSFREFYCKDAVHVVI